MNNEYLIYVSVCCVSAPENNRFYHVRFDLQHRDSGLNENHHLVSVLFFYSEATSVTINVYLESIAKYSDLFVVQSVITQCKKINRNDHVTRVLIHLYYPYDAIDCKCVEKLIF